MANKIRLARATKSRIETIKETLSSYEIVYSLDTQELGVKNDDGTITYFGLVTELEWANILNKPNLDLKLDKDFGSLPSQNNLLLSDVVVLNRGSSVQKTTLGALLALVDTEIFIVVSELPASGVANKIYLVPKISPESDNSYDEFIWKDNAWELLGNVKLDLSDYYNKDEVDELLDAHNIRFDGSGTNYLVSKTDVESAVKELDTQVALRDTMFEMFKRELRGYNLAMPDLTGKTDLGGGVYRIYNANGVTVDYNVNNGEYLLNGTSTTTANFVIFNYNESNDLTVKMYELSGSADPSTYPRGSFRYTGQPNNDITKSNLINGYYHDIISHRFAIWSLANVTYDNYKFKIKIEKGSTATPYTVPGQIPVGALLTDLDAHNVRFNGSGTNYLVSKTDVESAVKELDTQVKDAKDANDTTAKLAVSNLFTQPQQVPNATLPQHATNKLQVDTMFEMFKRELRGYNLAMPDLTGKTDLGGGVYVLYQGVGSNIVTYNVNTGIYKYKNDGNSNISLNIISNLSNFLSPLTEYTFTYEIISGSINTAWRPFVTVGDMEVAKIHQRPTFQINDITPYNYLRLNWGFSVEDYEFTIQIEKGSTKTPYTVPGQIPQYLRQVENFNYKSIGKTLAKTDITRPGAPNGGTVVGNEYWAFQASNDANTNYADCHRWLINEETLELTHLGSFYHNWGHVNSVDYCIETDTLICGNGSGSRVLDGKIFIFENASSFKEMSQVTLIDNAIIIDVGMTYGVKVNVVWGNDNDGRYDIAHVITNDNRNITRIQLGKGTNDLGLGDFVSGKLSNEFNGSYKVLKTWSQPDGLEVVQGADYGDDGFLYVGLGHLGAFYAKQWLNDNGSISGEVSKTLFINEDGTTNDGFTQSISEYKDKLILRIIKDGSHWAYVINK